MTVTAQKFLAPLQNFTTKVTDFTATHRVDSMLGFTAACLAITSPLGLTAAGGYCAYMGIKYEPSLSTARCVTIIFSGIAAFLCTPVIVGGTIQQNNRHFYKQAALETAQKIGAGMDAAESTVTFDTPSFLHWGFRKNEVSTSGKLVGERIVDSSGAHFTVHFADDKEGDNKTYYLPARPVPKGYENAIQLAPVGAGN